ncbi:kelch motif protein (macronuclear) [Tetrahymena thermophila SB210]|uniref:Kelch motif protein n=1 Tax=Tetrahymena thermophila (strain SB210) TaxID=312017 RepID=W7X8S8_TETTS|nr:kelch motif protein [Tetrahymena thermophila SB210]EWS75775.1 kelch motif protein [Tetrahymena thermophila SB210]|eukprot:XP_012651697.1 kelch motif protein [Tetrahymena thermophila SB210]
MSQSKISQRIDPYDEISQFLFENQDKKLQIIIVIGSPGAGKSLFSSYLVSEQQENPRSMFPPSQSSQIEFFGIKFYLCKAKFQLLLEFEGIDYSQDSEQMNSIQNCLKDIADTSTFIFYIHKNCRNNKGFEQILNLINAHGQKKYHLVEILNQWNGDSIQSYRQSPQYKDVFLDEYYLKSLNYKNNTIQKDDNLNQFLGKMKEIHELIKNCELQNQIQCDQVNPKIFQKFRENQVEFLNMEQFAQISKPQTGYYFEIKKIIQKVLPSFSFCLSIIISIIQISNE